MPSQPPFRIKTVSDYHRVTQQPPPAHPLLGVINVAAIRQLPISEPVSLVTNFYLISLKRGFTAKMKYGQQAYDFNEGVLSFMAPGQVFGLEPADAAMEQAGWVLLIHPDFLWNTSLAPKIKQYEFFGYAVNEALFLSAKEEATISQLIATIEQEYHANTDKFSQGIIVSLLESLLNYAERFYQRQFLTRRISSHQLLARLEDLLHTYFAGDELASKGLPTVSYVAEALHVSADYLSSLLRTLTGLTTQQHIHEKLLEKAKEKLSTTALSVSEIAYELGFEHPQSFSRLFKTKTSLSPLKFRQSFN